MRLRTAVCKVPPQCGSCGSQLTIGGPVWNEPIHNVAFVKRLLEKTKLADCPFRTASRLEGILGGIIDEEPVKGNPLSFNLPDVCSTIRAVNPQKEKIYAAFASLGYRVCQTYYDGDLWKTDAPPEAVYDIFKKWKQQTSPETYLTNVPEKSPAKQILLKPIQYDADFDFKAPLDNKGDGGHQPAGQKRLGKYFTATEPNWGPKPRATGGKKAKAAE